LGDRDQRYQRCGEAEVVGQQDHVESGGRGNAGLLDHLRNAVEAEQLQTELEGTLCHDGDLSFVMAFCNRGFVGACALAEMAGVLVVSGGLEPAVTRGIWCRCR
jgi:hypothetical protein